MAAMTAARLTGMGTWAARDSTAPRGIGARGGADSGTRRTGAHGRAARDMDGLRILGMKETRSGTAAARITAGIRIAKDGRKAMEQAGGPEIHDRHTLALAPRTRAAQVIRRVHIIIRAINADELLILFLTDLRDCQTKAVIAKPERGRVFYKMGIRLDVGDLLDKLLLPILLIVCLALCGCTGQGTGNTYQNGNAAGGNNLHIDPDTGCPPTESSQLECSQWIHFPRCDVQSCTCYYDDLTSNTSSAYYHSSDNHYFRCSGQGETLTCMSAAKMIDEYCGPSPPA